MQYFQRLSPTSAAVDGRREVNICTVPKRKKDTKAVLSLNLLLRRAEICVKRLRFRVKGKHCPTCKAGLAPERCRGGA